MLGLVKTQGQAHHLILRANMLLPGLYAWLTTVAFPTTYRGAASASRVSAFIALLALLSGPILVFEWPRLGRALGVFVFVGFSLVTWVLLGSLVSVDRLEPVRSALGAVGWALFAFGWGTVRHVGSVPEEDPNVILGPPLVARSRLPKLSLVVIAVSVGGALVPLFFAWRVIRPEHGLLAHAVALLCAVAVVTSGATIALACGQHRVVAAAQSRINAAVRPLAALALMLGLGFVWLLLH